MNQVETRKIHHDIPLAAAWGAVAAATLLVFAAIIAVPILRARSSIVDTTEITEGRGICGDQYNALVRQAKQDLIKGDRAGAIRLLRAAKVQLHVCEVRSTQEVAPMFPN
jgi:hypothetical protein